MADVEVTYKGLFKETQVIPGEETVTQLLNPYNQLNRIYGVFEAFRVRPEETSLQFAHRLYAYMGGLDRERIDPIESRSHIAAIRREMHVLAQIGNELFVRQLVGNSISGCLPKIYSFSITTENETRRLPFSDEIAQSQIDTVLSWMRRSNSGDKISWEMEALPTSAFNEVPLSFLFKNEQDSRVISALLIKIVDFLSALVSNGIGQPDKFQWVLWQGLGSEWIAKTYDVSFLGSIEAMNIYSHKSPSSIPSNLDKYYNSMVHAYEELVLNAETELKVPFSDPYDEQKRNMCLGWIGELRTVLNLSKYHLQPISLADRLQPIFALFSSNPTELSGANYADVIIERMSDFQHQFPEYGELIAAFENLLIIFLEKPYEVGAQLYALQQLRLLCSNTSSWRSTSYSGSESRTSGNVPEALLKESVFNELSNLLRERACSQSGALTVTQIWERISAAKSDGVLSELQYQALRLEIIQTIISTSSYVRLLPSFAERRFRSIRKHYTFLQQSEKEYIIDSIKIQHLK